MNLEISLQYWMHFFGWLAFEMLLIGGIAGILSHFIVSATLRRTLWRGALLSLLLLVMASLLGLNRIDLRSSSEKPKAMTEASISTKPMGEWRITENSNAPLQIAGDQSVVRRNPVVQNSAWSLLPVWIWLAISVVQIIRTLHIQVKISRIRFENTIDSSISTMIQRLSMFLRLKRIPEAGYIPQLPTPIAMGFRKPMIGLPENFMFQFCESQQRVVLLHELAHLKAQDPIWHLTGRLITAICWWHPVSWWMQRQLDLTTEMAADEASMLMENGACTLAECLVQLGRISPLSTENAWMGVVGDRFRSGLGQRVHRLLNNKKSANLVFRTWMLHGIMAGEFLIFFCSSILVASWFAPKLSANTLPVNLSSSPAGKMIALFAAEKSPDTQNVIEELRTYRIVPSMITQIFENRGIAISDKERNENSVLFEKYFQAGGLKLTKGSYLYRDSVSFGCVRASVKELDAVEKNLGITPTTANPIVNDPKAAVNSRLYVLKGQFFQSIETALHPLSSRMPNPSTLVPHFFSNLLGLNFSEGDPKWNATAEDLAKAANMDPRRCYLIFRDKTVTIAARATESQLKLIDQVLSVLDTVPAQIMIEAKFLDVSENAALKLELLKTGEYGTNLLSNAEFRELFRQMEQLDGVDIMSAPRVVTLNGRQAQVSIMQAQSIVFPDNLSFPLPINAKSGDIQITYPFQISHPYNDMRVSELTYPEVNTNNTAEARKVNLGVSLDIVPVVQLDERIELTLIPMVTDFLGYVDSEKDKNLKKPTFRVFQTAIKTALYEGQALVCGPMFYNKTVGKNAAENQWRISSLGKRALFLIVTAQCIEPTGIPPR